VVQASTLGNYPIQLTARAIWLDKFQIYSVTVKTEKLNVGLLPGIVDDFALKAVAEAPDVGDRRLVNIPNCDPEMVYGKRQCNSLSFPPLRLFGLRPRIVLNKRNPARPAPCSPECSRIRDSARGQKSRQVIENRAERHEAVKDSRLKLNAKLLLNHCD
jgi:hypothetical protein